MYQHNWAALGNTDAAFFVLKGGNRKLRNNYSKSDITTQYLCKEKSKICFGGCILLKLMQLTYQGRICKVCISYIHGGY